MALNDQFASKTNSVNTFHFGLPMPHLIKLLSVFWNIKHEYTSLSHSALPSLVPTGNRIETARYSNQSSTFRTRYDLIFM